MGGRRAGKGDEKKEGRVEGWEEGQQRQRDGGKKNCGAGVWEKGGQGMRMRRRRAGQVGGKNKCGIGGWGEVGPGKGMRSRKTGQGMGIERGRVG